MINFLNKFIKRTNNLDYVSKTIKDLSKDPSPKKIFDAINEYSPSSEIRYVGGCIRKIIQKEIVDDIDLATNLNPMQVCDALKNNNINYYETGIDHGTITAVIKDYKFEITSLREDINTDGRHAEVKFSTDWKKDASRRDFTINSIYSDLEGNLFDPFDSNSESKIILVSAICGMAVGETKLPISIAEKPTGIRLLKYLNFSFFENSLE